MEVDTVSHSDSEDDIPCPPITGEQSYERLEDIESVMTSLSNEENHTCCNCRRKNNLLNLQMTTPQVLELHARDIQDWAEARRGS